MNEDNNNNQEELNEQAKTKNNAKELEKGIKDSANLAKNVASGNVLGAAKDALNLAKNKKFRKKIIKRMIIQTIAPFLIILILASVVLGIFGAVGDTIQNVLEGIGSAIVDFFTVDDNGAIKISTNQIDTIINSIQELGVSVEDLKLLGDYDINATEEQKQEALRKYIRKFYEAQVVTETLNYNKGRRNI